MIFGGGRFRLPASFSLKGTRRVLALSLSSDSLIIHFRSLLQVSQIRFVLRPVGAALCDVILPLAVTFQQVLLVYKWVPTF